MTYTYCGKYAVPGFFWATLYCIATTMRTIYLKAKIIGTVYPTSGIIIDNSTR